MQSVLAGKKYGNVHKNEERGDIVNIIWYPLKNKTVVLRRIYNKIHIKMFQRLQPPEVELVVL